MRLRLSLALLCVAVISAIAAYVFSTYDPDAARRDWPILKAAKTSGEQLGILIGSNVQVSPTDDSVNYWECVIAADPKDPSHLVAAAMRRRGRPEVDIVCFYSHDGGVSWHLGREQICPKRHAYNDPTVAFGPDDTVYLAHMDVDRSPPRNEDAGALLFLASTDGGRTWKERDRFPNYVDRPWLSVDCGSRDDRGSVYCLGQVEPRSPDGEISHAEPIFFRSADGLQTVAGPVWPHGGRRMINCRPANPVVLSDGTLLLAYQDRYLKRHINTWPRPAIYTARSSDGGRTFEESTPVNTRWWHDHVASSGSSPVGAEFPALAADLSSPQYSGNVYCVWSDGFGDDGTKVFFSKSGDGGKTWSNAIVLSEQPMSDDEFQNEYLTFTPCIAVNKDGVVAVAWYDRRGLPKSRREPMKGADAPVGAFDIVREGWSFRVRISVDGGGSWLPSVQVNEETGRGDLNVGHTAGLASDADGRFHAVWVDNRTGKNKLWTASIAVKGRDME